MWVSRKEFNQVVFQLKTVLDSATENASAAKVMAYEAKNSQARLTKQVGCSCENYEVRDKHQIMCEHDGRIWWAADRFVGILEGCRYEKHCLDCGWTTTYDTEEDALEDKQALLDKQIDALKEQKKSLKKK